MVLENDFQIDQGSYGVRMTLTGQWDPSLRVIMLQRDVKELYLNYAKGWRDNHLGFLEGLDFLLALDIINWKIKDLAPIYHLINLKSLSISTVCEEEFDFRVFKNLESCALTDWWPGANSVFQCHTLKHLFMSLFNENSFESLKDLKRLESLRVKGGTPRSLEGLSSLKNLNFLGLYALKRLSNLSGLKELCNLRRLDLESCPEIHNYSEIGSLENLETLFLNDQKRISSINFTRNLKQLKHFHFIESTYIEDGDLTPIVGLHNLESVTFQNRRHYSHKREYFWSYLRDSLS